MINAVRVSALSQDARTVASPLPSPTARLREAAGAVPPTGLILMSILSVQVGAALAKSLFASLGPGGTVFLRIGFAAVIMLAVGRPRIRGHRRADYVAMVLFGLTIAGMNLSFYSAIARLPLGIAVTLEFVGPLCVAVIGSRRRLDLLWAAFAGGGILLLAPWDNSAIDPLGVVFALTAAGGWAAYILLNVRVGRAFPGQSGLALAMGISCLVTLPLGIGASGPLLGDPRLLAAGLGVSVLSTVIPFSLEHAALKRLPAQVFGVLMSLEPAVAALVGVILLHQALGLRALLALVGVTLASVGSARSSAGD
ncbi:MAG TPA: EamA family transporter [Chloroflexota bacterium]|nr:EamA family transporter [Chloroflexota bacterium]